MRVKRNDRPPTAFSLEPHPTQLGFVCVRFFENATQITLSTDSSESEEGNYSVTLWAVDEYMLLVPNKAGLEAEIETNYDDWLITAKSQHPQDVENATLRQALSVITGGILEVDTDIAGLMGLEIESLPQMLRSFIESNSDTEN